MRLINLNWRRTLAAVVGSALLTTIAAADTKEPVAIVEDASTGAPVAAFEYLRMGQSFTLGSSESIVIGYLASCRLETITGGTVVVGERQSVVRGGKLTARRIDCDGGQIELSPEAAAAGGITVYRAPGDEDLRIYSATPAFAVLGAGHGTIEIQRLDREEPETRIALDGPFVDLSAKRRALNPGGVYEVRLGNRRRTFRIVVYARPGGPLTSRLVPL